MTHVEPLHGHEGWVRSVAAEEVDGVPVVVSGGDDGPVRVWYITEPINQARAEVTTAVWDAAIFDNHVITAGAGLGALHPDYQTEITVWIGDD